MACSPSTYKALLQCHKVRGSVQNVMLCLWQGRSIESCISREAASVLHRVLDGVRQAMLVRLHSID